VFKGFKKTLQPGEVCTLFKKHSLQPRTIRNLYIGKHFLEIQINGNKGVKSPFDLMP